ncbi:MAG: hypothetical protein FWE39_20440, partial [Nocardiaceae bacterium]|nr:hypothetical protein [Nocardiaceae bacterium]
MSALLLIMLLAFGVNTFFWTTVGLGRTVVSRWGRWRGPRSAARPDSPPLTPADVAVLIAAHNE